MQGTCEDLWGLRLRSRRLCRPTSRHALKSKSRGRGWVQLPPRGIGSWQLRPGGAVLEAQRAALGDANLWGRVHRGAIGWRPLSAGPDQPMMSVLSLDSRPWSGHFILLLATAPPSSHCDRQRPAATSTRPAPFGAPSAVICLRICSFSRPDGMMASGGLWPGPQLPRLGRAKSISAGIAHEKSSPRIWPYENGFLGKFRHIGKPRLVRPRADL